MNKLLGALPLSLLATNALADTAAPEAGGFNFQSIIMLVVFVVIFYFLLIRPQMRRNKEMRNLLNSISNGDEVVTSGGMLGRVEKVGDTYVELALADNVVVKLQKQAIASVVPKGTIKNV